ncbi:MFS transporter [Staphylococcus epidermidis]
MILIFLHLQLSLLSPFFMIGLALGNFLAGPISDITGRKKPLIFSLIIFTIASLGIIFVTNIWIMIILRFIQGLTGGAGAVISRAIASDMSKAHEKRESVSR